MKKPKNIRALPHRGTLPVPWFVKSADDFRIIDTHKLQRAFTERLCWVCGKPLGKTCAFTGGPKSYKNRLYADPPAHPECAHYSAVVCPFLASPEFVRRGDDLDYPENMDVNPIPEVHLLIVKTGKYKAISDGLIQVAGKLVEHAIYHRGIQQTV